MTGKPRVGAPSQHASVAWELFAAVLVAYAVLLVGVHALGNGLAYDFGIYYRGAAAAWETGHPGLADGWVGTPFAAAVLGPLTRVLRLADAARLVTVGNLAIVATAGVALWRMLRSRMRVGWALAATAGSTFLFAPVVSTIWWRQLNLIALGLAVLGFLQVRRAKPGSGAALIGLSLALKPLLVMLPVALMLRRETRRAGVLALLWAAGLTAVGQVFLAIRASDAGLLDPWRAYQDFTTPAWNPAGSHACHPGNVSLQATTCRIFGTGLWSGQRVLALGIAVALAWVALAAVRRYRGTSFEYLAVACAISPMFGPIEWTHYQVALAPLLLTVALHLVVRPRRIAWVLLIVAYVGLSLVWSPAMAVARLASDWFGGTPLHDSFVLMRLAMVFQYLLLGVGCWVLWADAAGRMPDPPFAGTCAEPARTAAVAR
jgi:hypothetical protein